MGHAPQVSSNMNESYKKDMSYSIQLSRWFLLLIGAWPSSVANLKIEKALAPITVLLCFSVIVSVVVPAILHIIFEEDDLQKKIKATGPIINWIMIFTKYLSLLLHADDIGECILHMELDWRRVRNSKDRRIMIQSAKVGRYTATFCVCCISSGIFSYFVVIPSSVVIENRNETLVIRLLAFPFYSKIADTTDGLAYEIVFWIQFIFNFIVTFVTVSACNLAAVLVAHANGQLQVLMSWLNEFIDGRDREKGVPKKLSIIVEYHLRILRFIAHIEKIMNQICFAELVGCTLIICLLGYYMIKEWEQQEAKSLVAYAILFVSFSFNIFIFCYIGEILSEQCRKVGETVYMTNWYLLPGKTSMDLILIISRSSLVIRITAGKLIKLSIVSFSDVMRTAMVYLNMLRTITAK